MEVGWKRQRESKLKVEGRKEGTPFSGENTEKGILVLNLASG